MGGSGKKVEGIPAYFWGEDTSNYAEVTEDTSGMAGDPSIYTATDEVTYDMGDWADKQMAADKGQTEGIVQYADISPADYEGGGMGGYSPTQVKEFTKTASKSRATGDDDTGYMAGPKELTDMRKGILGLYGDRMTRGEALEGA